MQSQKIIAFDIDGVLLTRPDHAEELGGVQKFTLCEPIQKNIDICNELYDQGHRIILYTARGQTSLNGDMGKITEHMLPVTEQKLKEYNVKYHELIFGKRHFDVLIDDRAFDSADLQSSDQINERLKQRYLSN